jgi:hypothetical protein
MDGGVGAHYVIHGSSRVSRRVGSSRFFRRVAGNGGHKQLGAVERRRKGRASGGCTWWRRGEEVPCGKRGGRLGSGGGEGAHSWPREVSGLN